MADRGGETSHISDKNLVALINKGLDAREICERADISLPTLQWRIGEVMQKYKKFVYVPGLYARAGTIRFSGSGIFIENRLKAGDEFSIEVDGDCSISLAGNRITVKKMGPSEEEQAVKREDKVTPMRQSKPVEQPPPKKTERLDDDIESLDSLFEEL
ncbi:MAG: hypothetical protein H8D67_15080 [Deltaproteobacteria bacterium]|nr:hypothetical protein [Deltaproteobacteria bacterium]